MATWCDRALRRNDQLLARVQWLFVLFNCLLAVTSPLDLTDPEAPAGQAAAVLLATAVALAVWSVVYFRRNKPSVVLDGIPLVLLLVQALAAGDADWIFARLYVSVFLVSLYRPGRRRHLALAMAYLVVYKGAGVLTGEPLIVAGVIAEAISLLVVIGIMQTLAAAVARHQVFAQRDMLLTEVVGGLLAERNPARINKLVADTALRLVGVPGALVTLWRSDGQTLHRTGLAGRDTYPLMQADLTGLSEEFRTIYHGGHPAYLDVAQLNALDAYYGIDERFLTAIVAPVLRDGEPTGLLVVSSREHLDPDLLPVLERFSHEVALAQQLAERETMLTGVVENSSDVIAVLDEDSVFTYVSPAITAATGQEPSTLLGRPVGSLLRRGCSGDPVVDADEFPRHTPSALSMEAAGQRLDVEVTANALADGTTILNIRDVSDRRRLEAEIEYRAFHDAVTGLPNRALLIDRLEHAVRRRERTGGLVAVALIDVDDFKGVNDSLGHAAGDTLLRHIAERLTGTLRGSDTAARIGGDEFALVLEGFDGVASVTMVVERTLAALREPITLEGREIHISASVGLTVAADHADAEELMRNADAAMYAAKKSGKNRCAMFDVSMLEQGINRLELRTELEASLSAGDFVVHYQPMVALASGAVMGVEALVRWDHPTRGVVPPLEFIPVAEETGLIVPLGRWVLQESCRQVGAWQRSSRTAMRLSVNLSAVQLRSPDLVKDVAWALRNAGLEPSHLTLELTETALMGDTETVAGVLQGLKDLGVRLSIDDFGTGYSSFTHLQSLPIDAIKVDRSFVHVVGDGPEHAAYAEAIVNIAHTLGLETVAEGVETEEQCDLLRGWGCSLGQGWLWHAAMPADEVAAVIARTVPARSVHA